MLQKQEEGRLIGSVGPQIIDWQHYSPDGVAVLLFL